MIHKYMLIREDSFSVSYQAEAQKIAAESFAQQHQFVCNHITQARSTLLLHFTEAYVELKDCAENVSIHIDFLSGDMAHRQQFGGGRGQSIAKAIGLKSGIKPPHVLDATAGLANDAFVLANLACRLTLLEQSPIVVKLIQDAIQRAALDDDFKCILAQGFEVINQNAIDYMQTLKDEERPDIVYLDPMFPERKKSAQVKKNMQILQKLLGHNDNNEALLTAALHCALKRVVVKRPKIAPYLGENKPSMSIETKKMRYDVYVLAAMK